MTLDTSVVNILHQYAKIYCNFDEAGKKQIDVSASMAAMTGNRGHVYLLIYEAFKTKYINDKYKNQQRLTLE